MEWSWHVRAQITLFPLFPLLQFSLIGLSFNKRLWTRLQQPWNRIRVSAQQFYNGKYKTHFNIPFAIGDWFEAMCDDFTNKQFGEDRMMIRVIVRGVWSLMPSCRMISRRLSRQWGAFLPFLNLCMYCWRRICDGRDGHMRRKDRLKNWCISDIRPIRRSQCIFPIWEPCNEINNPQLKSLISQRKCI